MPLVIREEPTPLRKDGDGVIRVANTRVTLLSILDSFQRGDSPGNIAEQFPSVELSDIYATIAFYLRHKSDVDEYLEEERTLAKKMQEENEKRFPSEGLREKLF